MDVQTFLNQYPLVIAIAAVWSMMQLVSRFTGWHALARHYPASSPFNGKHRHFQTVWMRWGSHYGNGVTAGADAQGLFLSVLFILRIGHPPLFIPWGDVDAHEMQGGFTKRIKLQFKRLPSVPMVITVALADDLAKDSYGAFIVQKERHP
ncbi:MAG TPA: hypothetical protein VGB38_02770 [bacterium]